MKVLVTTTPGLGHVLPVLSLALELRNRGHDLHWMLGPDDAEVVEGTGIEMTVAGMPVDERRAELTRRYPEADSLPPAERRAVVFSKAFGELAAPRMVAPVMGVAEQFGPDVVVHDAAELAAPLVAARVGITSVCHGFGEAVPELSVRRAGEQLAPLWRDADLTPDRYAGSYRGLYVDIYPPSLRSQDMAHIPRIQMSRPTTGEAALGGLVYVTFGTVFNQVDDHFRAAVLAAAAAAEEVLVTVGPAGNPEAVGAVPENVAVERFVPQADVLPRCGVVVCHGGSGTVLAALAHGLPLLCLPRGADQFANAANLARVGAGISLVGVEGTQHAIRAGLDQLLRTSKYRAAALSLAEEIATMPTESEVARAVEQFAELTPK
jgi:UDP:flavonoid glycosyltransferase YjiC (YdhE family)